MQWTDRLDTQSLGRCSCTIQVSSVSLSVLRRRKTDISPVTPNKTNKKKVHDAKLAKLPPAFTCFGQQVSKAHVYHQRAQAQTEQATTSPAISSQSPRQKRRQKQKARAQQADLRQALQQRQSLHATFCPAVLPPLTAWPPTTGWHSSVPWILSQTLVANRAELAWVIPQLSHCNLSQAYRLPIR